MLGEKMTNSSGGGFSGWDCPFCTYINKQSSFKCAMCGASRGTSTRQARLQPQMVDFFNIGEGQATTNKSSSTGSSSRTTTTHPPPRPSKSSSPSTSRSPSPASVTSITSTQQSSSKQTGPPPKHKAKLQTATSSSSMGKGVGSKGKVRTSRLRAQWPRVPNIDYHSGWTMEVRCAGENAAITEYQLLKS